MRWAIWTGCKYFLSRQFNLDIYLVGDDGILPCQHHEDQKNNRLFLTIQLHHRIHLRKWYQRLARMGPLVSESCVQHPRFPIGNNPSWFLPKIFLFPRHPRFPGKWQATVFLLRKRDKATESWSIFSCISWSTLMAEASCQLKTQQPSEREFLLYPPPVLDQLFRAILRACPESR